MPDDDDVHVLKGTETEHFSMADSAYAVVDGLKLTMSDAGAKRLYSNSRNVL